MKKVLPFIKTVKLGDVLIILILVGLIIFIINKSWNNHIGQYLKIEKNNEPPKIMSLNQIKEEKIIIVISHRKDILEICNKVYSLDKKAFN